MDSFFDIMNIRDANSHEFDLKPFPIPFSSIDDPRSSWLRNVFLQHFEAWLHSIEHCEGKFSKNAKNKMLILPQTYMGLKLLVNAIIEAVNFVFNMRLGLCYEKSFLKIP